MRRTAWVASLAAVVAASTLVVTAQIGGKPISGGNPTPGTAQPEPPNLGDRITLTGCLRTAPQEGAAKASAPLDDNTPTATRFVLTNAERMNRLPPGTGGSTLAATASGRTYRLEGLDSQFSPFVSMKVEISGEVKPRAVKEAAATSNVLTLLVEFVQKIEPRC